METLIVYTYYSAPWLMRTGDETRTYKIASSLGEGGAKVFIFVLSCMQDKLKLIPDVNVIHIVYPRKFYRLLSKVLMWNRHHDLNILWKIGLYIDELLACIILAKLINDRRNKISLVYIFGSMSLMPWFLSLLCSKKDLLCKPKIIYDPLANYAQTLFLLSRTSVVKLLKYGLYLVLHKLSLNASNIVVYPSQLDRDVAESMFNLKNKSKKIIVIPNPFPLCYESFDEYYRLRKQYKEGRIPHFLLLAGSRGKNNYDAVKLTIETFNVLPPEKFRLYITGPWSDLKNLVKNPSIRLTGIITNHELKALLAACDYGLSPVFSHVAGTFMKMLSYIVADLHIICSPYSLASLDRGLIKNLVLKNKIQIVRNPQEFKKIIQEKINELKIFEENRTPIQCNNYKYLINFSTKDD